ncbi:MULTISPECIES: hypothetical protein [Staphylococcus]|uniref:hypothetical protein n=1 Tax=Staphylococcus TaxID=1279 RepID=UPI0008A89FCE|nr:MULTISPECIES: hypothetical protein [Staphylococcus]MDT0758508.1 hypothetical protein [Staphylococcus epidermidis]OHQ89511.1 hypothetical protein HMPREF2739_00205 [Staphylococcus sp. HMSC074F11]TBW74581.1 hypothetical protein EQ807_12215 [Staphylococcus epidermidis]BEI31576.1 hypothetical protein [Staphylococcus epidermidis]
MNIKDQIDISKIILQIISMLVPLVGIILSQFKGTERRMDQKKEKMKRIFNNIFRFIFVIVLIDLLILVELRDFYINIKPENLIKYKKDIYQLILILTTFSTVYAFFLMPFWLKKKRYYEIELEHTKGKKIAYVVLNRDKSKNKDVIIYKDDKKEYEEDVDSIKQREGRVTFIPKAKSIFNLNRSAIEETKTLPIWSRWLFFILIILVSLVGIFSCIEMIMNVWTFNLGKRVVMFRIIISIFPITIFMYFIAIIKFLYQSWLGKNKLVYEKSKK